MQWQKLYRASGIPKERVAKFDANALELSAAREAARLAFGLEIKVHRLHKETSDKSWMRKAAEEAELMMSEDEDEDRDRKSGELKSKLKGLWQNLQARVRRPPKHVGAGPAGRRRKM